MREYISVTALQVGHDSPRLDIPAPDKPKKSRQRKMGSAKHCATFIISCAPSRVVDALSQEQ
jgi:hypothetical protein